MASRSSCDPRHMWLGSVFQSELLTADVVVVVVVAEVSWRG